MTSYPSTSNWQKNRTRVQKSAVLRLHNGLPKPDLNISLKPAKTRKR
jgi:hypothetical protein